MRYNCYYLYIEQNKITVRKKLSDEVIAKPLYNLVFSQVFFVFHADLTSFAITSDISVIRENDTCIVPLSPQNRYDYGTDISAVNSTRQSSGRWHR